MRRFLLGTVAVMTLAATVSLVPTIWFKPWSIDHFYARLFIRYALRLVVDTGMAEPAVGSAQARG